MKHIVEESGEFLEIVYDDGTPIKHTRRYQIVNSIPKGYHVWAIGDRMGVDDYIPICTLIPGSPDHVDAELLKAIKLPTEEAKILRNAAYYGIWNIDTAKEVMEYTPEKLADLAKIGLSKEDLDHALSIFERISE